MNVEEVTTTNCRQKPFAILQLALCTGDGLGLRITGGKEVGEFIEAVITRIEPGSVAEIKGELHEGQSVFCSHKQDSR